MTKFESSKLQVEMHRELAAPAYVIWKCAAGLVFVTALVLIGASSAKAPDAGAYATAQASSKR